MVCSKRKDVSGIILAGGASARLGQDKALVQVAGRPLVERVVEALRALADEIVLVTPSPERLAWLGLPAVDDVYPGIGTLGGLHAGLNAIANPYGLVVGCDTLPIAATCAPKAAPEKNIAE